MNPKIQADQRLVYINTLKSAHDLHQYIQYLDKKYGVDSTDPDNTFGRIFLNQPIIQNGVANTLYFAGISSYRPDDLRLPKHKAIPHANSFVVIDKTGNVGIATSQEHIKAQRVPIAVEESDIEKLVQLRNNFKDEIEAKAPFEPTFPNELLEKHNRFKDSSGKTYLFHELPQILKNEIYDRILEEFGFATGNKHNLYVTIYVPDNEARFKKFKIEFYRLHTNQTPHFSTTYQGWQAQNKIDKNHPAYKFYKKWNIFHTHNMTVEEWLEMKDDLDEVYKLSKQLAPKNIAKRFSYNVPNNNVR